MKVVKGLIVGILALGVVLIGIGFATGGDFNNMFASETYVLQDTISYSDEITMLDIDVETKIIDIKSTTDSEIRIDYYASENETWAFDLSDGILNITQRDPDGIRFWFNFSYAPRDERTLTVYIPKTYAFDVSIKSNTGDIYFTGFDQLKDVDISTNTGDLVIDLLTADLMNLSSDTGDIVAGELNIESKTMIHTSTGDVELVDSASSELDIKVSTGDIDITNIDAEKIDLDSDTGSITVAGVDLDGRSVYLDTDTGRVNFKGQSQGDEFNLTLDDANFYINASTDTGNVTVN